MPDFPSLRGGTRTENAGANTSNSLAGSVVGSASANTKGSYTELIASTSFAAQGVVIVIRGNSSSYDVLLDLAIGGSGSEQVVISNLLFHAQVVRITQCVYIPLQIPASQRLSARVQTTIVSGVVICEAILVGGGLKNQPGFGVCTTYGANTADSGAAGIDPGASANTKGAYTEITSATTRPIEWLIIAVGNRNNATETTSSFLVDIAIGGSGSEVVVIADLLFQKDSLVDSMLPCYYSLPVSIPAGSRIAARAQSSINDATDRLFDLEVIGVS